MAVNKVLLTFAFAMCLIICLQGIEVQHSKKDFHFGNAEDGDQQIMPDQNATADREVDHHHITPTYVVKPADAELRKKLGNKPEGYVPKITEIIILDQGGGATRCKIENGGMGETYVTLKFRSHLGGKLNYIVKIRGH